MSNPYKIDWNEYAALARQAVAEGWGARMGGRQKGA